jgi:alpha-glucosidase
MRTDRLTPVWIRANQHERRAAAPPGAWPCNTLGNHDSPRVLSRYGDGQHDEALARLSLALMLTLPGTPFLYNGEEIGMADLLLDDIHAFRDNVGVWQYHMLTREFGLPEAQAIKIAAQMSRDKCRTPMQWANAPNAGFSPPGVQTWLPLNPDYTRGVNVAGQERDPNSMLNFYRRLLRLRRQTPALIAGDFTLVDEGAEDYLAFIRRSGPDPACLVVLNFSGRSHNLNLASAARAARCLFSTHKAQSAVHNPEAVQIAPFEVFIGELES